MIIQPGIHFTNCRTEAQHDAALVRLDAEEPGEQPNRDGGEDDQA